tara:strand:+ start:173 stop:361 length:189 start_codon:yes stop_codon:yes gene_type:complete
MKIKVEKKIHNDEIVRIDELHLEIPQVIIDELNWVDGTVIEWESEEDGKVVLRNIDDKIMGD